VDGHSLYGRQIHKWEMFRGQQVERRLLLYVLKSGLKVTIMLLVCFLVMGTPGNLFIFA
jgi:hypothetical protein